MLKFLIKQLKMQLLFTKINNYNAKREKSNKRNSSPIVLH